MSALFADTFYFQARVNRHDQQHARVLAWSQLERASPVTTELVLVELGNSLAGSRLTPLCDSVFLSEEKLFKDLTCPARSNS
jgi:hypothetical protein